MRFSRDFRLTPGVAVGLLALAVALGGTAVAVPGATDSSLSTRKIGKLVRKQVRKQVRRQLRRLAPELSVARAAHADSAASAASAVTASTATSADSADVATNADNLGGLPPSAFALVAAGPYRAVGDPGQPAFINGWTNYGSPLDTAAFYKDSLGIVHLRGSLKNISGDNTDAFTLPVGYRPDRQLWMPVAGSATAVAGDNVPASVFVESGGGVRPRCEGSGGCEVGLDGLTFRAE